MAIVPQYMPKALSKDHVSLETHCVMEQDYVLDEKGKVERDDQGRKVKRGPARLVMKTIESKGGIMFTMPAGHSVRIASPAQMELFKLTEKPKLIDSQSGEEVNEHGIPLSLAAYVANAALSAPSADTGFVEADEDLEKK